MQNNCLGTTDVVDLALVSSGNVRDVILDHTRLE